ncbi:MAG: tRNA (adenosine(37)-N6)-threonylcarbamoyltransferase complex transferase subunit TsaD [Candidatus Dormibacteria bacterium]
MTLGIETSCDETAAAVVADGTRVVSNVVYSQLEQHREFGGVVPEVAARAHLQRLVPVVEEALARADTQLDGIDLIAVTRGPGLIGCLLVGIAGAQGMGIAGGKPVLGVNHLAGHVYSAFLAEPGLKPPVLVLIASGGHTDLVLVEAHARYRLLGSTRDDAAGECLDKCARLLGLGYPGGPALDRAARLGDASRVTLPRTRLPGHEFSFSGLKTAVRRHLELNPAPDQDAQHDLAAAVEMAVAGQLVDGLDRASRRTGIDRVAIVGGVSANTGLRQMALARFGPGQLTVPPLDLCTDNAAMIAAAGHFHSAAGETPAYPLLADPSLELG